MLNLSDNPLKSIQYHIFSLVQITVTVTSSFPLCCTISQVATCIAQKSQMSACSFILPNRSIKIMLIILSCLIILLNLFSSVRNAVNMKIKREGSVSSIIEISVNFGNLICGLHFLLLWVENYFYPFDIYLRILDKGSSAVCLSVFMLILLSTLLEPYFFSFLAIARLMVVKYPFESKFKSCSFVVKYAVYGITLSLVASISFVLRFTDKQTSLSSLCSPFIAPFDMIVEIKILTLLIAAWQSAALVFNLVLSISLVKSLKKIYKEYPQMSKSVGKAFTLQLICTTTVNLIGWVPCSLTFILCLYLPTYPPKLPMWNTVILLPISSLLNPIIFLIFDVKSKTYSSHNRLGR